MLEARGIHKIYKQADSELRVLRDVSLRIEKGEILAIIGPSGAGKSTLLHILGALDKPSEGEVLFEGQNIYRLRDAERARLRNHKIGFIFQFYHLLPEFSALENVILPAMVKEDLRSIDPLKSRGEEILSRVGLKHRLHHKPNQLSGGEQQRVAIARALINDPQVVFCDEPTGNLDSQSGQEIIELLVSLNVQKKQTLVIVTHDDNIARRSGRVVSLRDGQVVKS